VLEKTKQLTADCIYMYLPSLFSAAAGAPARRGKEEAAEARVRVQGDRDGRRL
jgi:hypothetical protein